MARLASDLARSGLTRQALILVGRPLEVLLTGEESPKSKLYAAGFSHGFRQGREG